MLDASRAVAKDFTALAAPTALAALTAHAALDPARRTQLATSAPERDLTLRQGRARGHVGVEVAAERPCPRPNCRRRRQPISRTASQSAIHRPVGVRQGVRHGCRCPRAAHQRRPSVFALTRPGPGAVEGGRQRSAAGAAVTASTSTVTLSTGDPAAPGGDPPPRPDLDPTVLSWTFQKDSAIQRSRSLLHVSTKANALPTLKARELVLDHIWIFLKKTQALSMNKSRPTEL